MMSKFINYLEFYEETLEGGFTSEPSCYLIEGKTVENVSDITDVLWQAVEIEIFDNKRILVKSRIENNGDVVCEDQFYIETQIVRTNIPSKFIKWNGKEAHIFEIDRKNSKLTIKEYLY